MAGRTSSAGRRSTASTRRTPATTASRRAADDRRGRETWPPRRAPARGSAARRAARRRRAANFPGPLDVVGKLIVGFWMGIAHLLGWIVRAVGRQAATARDLHPQHQRDGAGLLAFAVALLLAVAVWFDQGGVVGKDINEFARLLLGAAAVALPLILLITAIRMMRHPRGTGGASRPWRRRLVGDLRRLAAACSICTRTSGSTFRYPAACSAG